MNRTMRFSSKSSSVSSRVHAVRAIVLFIVGYGARITCRWYFSTIALSFCASSGHWQLYCTTTPPSSRLWTWSSGGIGRVCTPQGAMYGRCGPDVGGSGLFGSRGPAVFTRRVALVRGLLPRRTGGPPVGEETATPGAQKDGPPTGAP